MNKLSFDIANNWEDFPEFKRDVPWQTALKNDEYVQFIAKIGSAKWGVRLNDFPDEPCHTLIINGEEKLHFDDWPSFWIRPPFPSW